MNQPQNEPTSEQIHKMIWDRADDLGGYWIGVITDYHKHLENLLAEKDREIERLNNRVANLVDGELKEIVDLKKEIKALRDALSRCVEADEATGIDELARDSMREIIDKAIQAHKEQE